ncbi:MAG: T9SS type A sorting domain-containing protein [Sphingobacteriales bacterium]|nr:MAG: T9SS type A sorting domain-containing protein [Sphingobacteriales bacterium]
MKKFTFFLLAFIASAMSFAQNAPVNFETGGNGAGWTWTVFENATNPPLEVVANPDPSGINTSATVAKFTALQTGQPWAGCESLHGNTDLGPFVLDATNSIIKIMVWKSVISDVGIKLAAPTGWAQPEIKIANTLVNQWEELTFNFSSYLNPPTSEGQLDQIIVFPDFNLGGRTADNIIYFDNITFSAGGGGSTEPTVAAPTPTHPASNVISMFSDAYTNVPVDTWRTDWSAATLEDVLVAGNATKKYSLLDFVGIETVANQIDATGMTHFHLDVWSADFTFFGVKLVDFGADGAFGGGDDTEHQVNFNAPAQAQWASLDIPLSSFTGLTSQSNLAQLILVGQPSGANTVYVDNVLFFNNGGGSPEPTVAAPTPTHPAANVISMFSDAYTNVPVDTWRTDWSAASLEDVLIAGNATKKYSLLDFVGIETVANQINASAMSHFHLDVWSADFTFFGVKLVDFGADGAFGGGDDTEHQVNFTAPAQAQWVSMDIPLTDFTGLTSQSHIAQLILVAQPTGLSTVFVDNVYFYDINTGINDLTQSQIEILVFPNPVKAGTQLHLSEEVNQLDIVDLSGKAVLSSNGLLIDTTGLAKGIYLVKILTNEGLTQTKKLIVE